jgi:general secretion pathway protein D
MPFYVGTAQNMGAMGGTPPLINPGAPPPPPTTGGRGGGAGAGATPPPAGLQQVDPPARAVGVVPIQVAGDAAAGAAQIVLLGPEAALQVGGPPYNVPVRIEDVAQLGSVTLTVTYDPKVVKAVNVSQGSFMQQGGQTPVFAPKIDEAAGRVDIAIARAPAAPGAAGSGGLAGLVFEAVGPGTTTLTVTGVAMSPTGQPIAVKMAPVTVVVK